MASKTKSTKKNNQSKSDDLKKSIAKLKKTRKTISDETDQAQKKAKKLKDKKGKRSKLKKLKEVLAKLLKKEKKVTSKLKELKKEKKKANKPDEPKAINKPEKKKKKVILDENEVLNKVLEARPSSEHADSTIAKQDQPLNHSSIDHNVKEAVTHIRTLTDLQDIDIYVLGDKRITVQKAADARKNNLAKSQ